MTMPIIHQQLAPILQDPTYQCMDEWSTPIDLLRVIVAALNPKSILLLGNKITQVTLKVLEVVPISTQVLHATDDEHLFKHLKLSYINDIRLTCHYQNFQSFIHDITQHRFSVIIADNTVTADINSLFQLLETNGIIAILPETQIKLSELDDQFWLSSPTKLLTEYPHPSQELVLITRKQISPIRRKR